MLYYCGANFTYVKKIVLIIIALFSVIAAKAQYRELVYFKIPVGETKYFRLDDKVLFKLKSDEAYTSRIGTINLITDTLYDINNVRFRPDNLEWISTPFTKGQRTTKIIVGSVFLAGGIATIVAGVLKYPSKKTLIGGKTTHQYETQSVNSIGICAAGLLTVGFSFEMFSLKPKKYHRSKLWGTKYQQ